MCHIDIYDLYCYSGNLDQNNMVRNTRHGTAPVAAKYVTGEDGANDLSSSVAQALTRDRIIYGQFTPTIYSDNLPDQ